MEKKELMHYCIITNISRTWRNRRWILQDPTDAIKRVEIFS
jgi:hypothetical protein